MNIAIHYVPEAYSIQGQHLMGRNSAGESFLEGYFRYSKGDTFFAQVQSSDYAEQFAHAANFWGRTEPVKEIRTDNLGALREVGTLFHPGPGIANLARQRGFYGEALWSICGITHTTSSARAMDALSDIITDPVQPWDALICPSRAVKSNVETILQAQVNELKERLGLTKIVVPQLPVIPLGIHSGKFEYSDEIKKSARSRIGTQGNTIVVLYMGRLSFHAKAHPLPMYQALEEAAKLTKKEVILVECGWHANDFIREAYQEAAKLACPNIKVLFLDGRDHKARETAWASADIFCSLVDNIQETFGIVPLEAMAAGLPLVVSNWDGYRDTVREGVDGFLIDTIMPAAGLGDDLAFRHALELDTYDRYCGQVSQLTSVDVRSVTQAFVELFKSKELRKKMGAAGQRRVTDSYDWKQIIPKYEELWTELNLIRSRALQDRKNVTRIWPARLDPFLGFAGYPSQQLTSETVLALTDRNLKDVMERAADIRKLAMVNFAAYVLPSKEEIDGILKILHDQALPVKSIVLDTPPKHQPFTFRSLVWLLKIGVLRIET
jgi:alpha-maltose-1-phosphate synthase